MAHFCMPSLPVVKSERRLSVTVQQVALRWLIGRLSGV